MSGGFVAVVGPSGAGKDAVIAHASAATAGDGVLFPRRVITRPAGPGEDHEPASEAAFARRRDAGEFALWWRAHGLSYGIPAGAADEVAAGRTVVANVSREVLEGLGERFGSVRTVRVSVPDEVRRQRIRARGREDDADAQARLARADPAPGFAYDLDIVNDGTVEEAGEQLVELIDTLR